MEGEPEAAPVMVKVPFAPTRTHLSTNRSNKNQKWSIPDDERLKELVEMSSELDWSIIAANFPHKTQQQVMERWTKVLDPNLTKGSWTGEEDQIIIDYVSEHGKKSWTKLAERLPGRIGKQCRERYINHLDPDINRAPFTADEDKRIIELHNAYGNKWSKIASFMPNRTCNAIKNRWNSTLKKTAAFPVASLPEPLVMTDINHINIGGDAVGSVDEHKIMPDTGLIPIKQEVVSIIPVFSNIPLAIPPEQPSEEQN